MGVEWEIHDLKNKRKFDLGKCGEIGFWLRSLSYADYRSLGMDGLAAKITELWNTTVYVLEPDDGSYGRLIAQRVYSFVVAASGNVELHSDTETDDELIERLLWPTTGSRYTGDGYGSNGEWLR